MATIPGHDRIPETPPRVRRRAASMGDAYVPYIGALKDIDLGSQNFTTTGIVTGSKLVIDNITIDGNTIVSDTDTIDLTDNNLTTTGTVTANGLDIDGGGPVIDDILDDDTMATATDTSLSTSESIVAYVSSSISAVNLGDLNDVTITDVGDNDLLAYDSGTPGWINQTAAEAGLEPTLTKGNLTATSPIALNQTRQVIGGAAVISHASTAGNKHVPTGGSPNQILKNSGSSGTATWGTVTENAGALGNVTNITASGTVQAEQITSTDDITGAGKLTLTPSKTDSVVIDVGGATNTWSGTGTAYIEHIVRTVDSTVYDDAGWNFYCTRYDFINNRPLQGTPFVGFALNYGLYYVMTVNANHSATSGIITGESNRLMPVYLARGGSITGGGAYQLAHEGYFGTFDISTDFNNAGGAYTVQIRGSYIDINDTQTLTAGALSTTAVAYEADISGGAAGTVTSYGLKITSLIGTKYGIYDSAGSDWVMAYDGTNVSVGGRIVLGASKDSLLYYDGVNNALVAEPDALGVNAEFWVGASGTEKIKCGNATIGTSTGPVDRQSGVVDLMDLCNDYAEDTAPDELADLLLVYDYDASGSGLGTPTYKKVAFQSFHQKTRGDWCDTDLDKTNTTFAYYTNTETSYVTLPTTRKFSFTFNLWVDADATGGHKYQLGATGITATSLIYTIKSIDEDTGDTILYGRGTALETAHGENSSGATSIFTQITGLIEVNNGGTLRVQFAQQAANNTSSLLKGSHLIVQEVAP